MWGPGPGGARALFWALGPPGAPKGGGEAAGAFLRGGAFISGVGGGERSGRNREIVSFRVVSCVPCVRARRSCVSAWGVVAATLVAGMATSAAAALRLPLASGTVVRVLRICGSWLRCHEGFKPVCFPMTMC